MAHFEKHGIPTVAITSKGFERNAGYTAKSVGYEAELPLAVVPNTISHQAAEHIERQITDVFDQILAGLTQPPVARKAEDASAEVLRFEGKDHYDAFEVMNEAFLESQWGDGFPIIPPTPERVERTLQGTRRSPGEVVAILEPGSGLATVEKIAINSVMAGCKPEHLPVLIAAVEAISEPKFLLKGVASSTGPHTPMLMINGPLAKTLTINSGRCALGPGAQSRNNIVIGRALRLILMNIGQAYPGLLDMDTIGSPNKFSMCLAENEEASPWEPYHVEQGFARETSTVTAFSVESQLELIDGRSTRPEDFLTLVAGTANTAGAACTSDWLLPLRVWHSCLMVAPDHARSFEKHGWSKKDAREYLYENARVEWRYFKHTKSRPPQHFRPEWQWLEEAPDDYLLPITGGSDWFHIVVAGGPAGKSSYLTGLGQPVTKEIRP